MQCGGDHPDNLFGNTNVIIIRFCCLSVCVILFMAEIQFWLNETINFFLDSSPI